MPRLGKSYGAGRPTRRTKARALPLPPGLAKKAAGAQSARDFAPGRAGKPASGPVDKGTERMPKVKPTLPDKGVENMPQVRSGSPTPPKATPAKAEVRNVRASQAMPTPPAIGARRKTTLPPGLAKRR